MSYNFRTNLTGCSINHEGSTVDSGMNNFTITSDEGYELINKGFYEIGDSFSPEPPKRTNFTPDSKDKTKLFIEVNGDLYIEMKATKKEIVIPKHSFSKQVTNCNIDYNDSLIEEGEHTFTITSDEGYKLDSNGYYLLGDSNSPEPPKRINFTTDSDDKHTLNINVTDDLTIVIKATEIPKPINFKFSTDLVNCTIDYDSKTIEKGVHTFTITSDEGYELNEKGKYYIGNLDSPEPPKIVEFFPDNTKTTTLTINVTNNLHIELKANKQTEAVSSFTLLYSTNDNELGKLSLERFNNTEDGSRRDYGENILALYKLPVTLNLDVYENFIKWGDVTTKVSSHRIVEPIYSLDLGEVSVKEKYHNAFDYSNGYVDINLPFLKPLTTDIDTVMNKTLKFQYVINLYNGSCTVNIVDSEDDVLLLSENRKLGMDIPFIQLSTTSNFNKLDTYVVNDVRRVEVITNTKIPNDTIYNSSEINTIRNLEGYIEGSILSSSYNGMLSNDINELKSIVRSGIFINEPK